MYSAATTAIQPMAAAARAALAIVGAAARRCTCHASRQRPMPSIVPTRDSVGSTCAIARAVETTITKNTAYATSRILPVKLVPNHRIVSGIHANGTMKRSDSTTGVAIMRKRRHSPISTPTAMPSERADRDSPRRIRTG